jgi:hypothetical protein
LNVYYCIIFKGAQSDDEIATRNGSCETYTSDRGFSIRCITSITGVSLTATIPSGNLIIALCSFKDNTVINIQYKCLIGSESVQVFLSFIYICIAVGDPVIKYIV